MTRRWVRLTLLSLSVIMGWAFGFIKVPYIKDSYSFWVGFVGCFGMIGFVIALLQIFKNDKIISFFESAYSPKMRSQILGFIKNKLLICFIFIALLICGIVTYLSNKKLIEKLNLTNTEINELKYNANLEQHKNKISLLIDLLNNLDSTKVNFEDKSEADKMIDRIAKLSSSFKIYKEWDMENKVFQFISSERGLLLLALVKTKMDSNTFYKIKENVSFYGADLRNADFHGLNLSGIELKNANLEYANLQGVNLNYANLTGASLVGVNLNHATLVGANLTSVKLNWAKVNEADLHMAKLDSADFSNATIQKSKLNNTSLIQTVLCNAILLEADLDYSLMMSTNLSNANLSKTLLSNAFIYTTNFGSTNLNDAIIRDNWIERLRGRNNPDVNTILEKYNIDRDSMSIQDSIIYRLTPKTQ